MREGLNRLALVLVLTVFCLPLFFGLGRTDLENDEAIYSYAVQSILETGDWLSPRSSPNEAVVFFEKPPLKFWLVAAPIAAGLLPNNEFGLRFLDPVLGSLAFVYVFLLGRRLAGPVCGVTAVLVLFAHGALLFDHGLRSNNMEAALLLSYCGAVHHYLRWASAASPRARGGHIAAIAAFFFLGFMTKFVAALFVPIVLGLPALLVGEHRRTLKRDWLVWAAALAVVVVLVVPWFVYQHLKQGPLLWQVMFEDHVYERFTAYADARHVQPWHFYFSRFSRELDASESLLVAGFGLAVLVASTIRRLRPDAVVILIWGFVPPILMSLGTSKLYHYFYPYLPPFALAAGYGVAWVAAHLAPLIRAVRDFARRDAGPLTMRRRIMLGLMGLSLALALATAIFGPLRVTVAGVLLRNSSVLRPLLFAVLFGLLAGRLPLSVSWALVIAVLLAMPSPLTASATSLRRTVVERQQFRRLRDCLVNVDALRRQAGETVRGLYAPVSAEAFLHPYFFYLRHAGGWHYAPAVEDHVMRSALFELGGERPVLLDSSRYSAYLNRAPVRGDPPAGISVNSAVIVLPGPYAECRAVWEQARPQPVAHAR